MKVFIVGVDEPVYLNPYVRAVIEQCPAEVVGVAMLTPRSRPAWRRTAVVAMLSLVVFSGRSWRRMLGWKLSELFARVAPIATHHTLRDVCRELGVPLIAISSACSREFAAMIRDRGIDVMLNQTSEILRGDILTAPRLGVINRHMAWLPSYRGAWPVFWQFANGEPRLGITIHRVDAGLDSGDIIVREAVDRLPDDTIATAYERLFARSPELTCEALRRLDRGAEVLPNAGPETSTYRTPTARDVLRFMLGRRVAPAQRPV